MSSYNPDGNKTASGYDTQGPKGLPSDWELSMDSPWPTFDQTVDDTWGVGAKSGNANNKGIVLFTDVGTDDDQITIVDTLGLSKVYQLVDSGTSGDEVSTGIVKVVIKGSASLTGAQLVLAIAHSNGHNGSLTGVNTGGSVVITQNRGGVAATGVIAGSITETVDSAGHMTITDFAYATTGPGNKVFRYSDNVTGLITTELHIDLTGLKAKGDQATDVIALDGVNAGYIYQNVVADNGIIFKYDVSCIKAPTQEIATITQDIDFAWNSSATIQYDGAAAATVDTATMVAGETIVVSAGVVTADHYLYVTEGDAAATTGVYASGQFVIRLFGYPVRT